jgi:hypothetical protein
MYILAREVLIYLHMRSFRCRALGTIPSHSMKLMCNLIPIFIQLQFIEVCNVQYQSRCTVHLYIKQKELLEELYGQDMRYLRSRGGYSDGGRQKVYKIILVGGVADCQSLLCPFIVALMKQILTSTHLWRILYSKFTDNTLYFYTHYFAEFCSYKRSRYQHENIFIKVLIHHFILQHHNI